MKHVVDRAAWADKPDAWSGEWQGAAHGSGVSVIFVTYDKPGGGPRLHTHPYSETFIVRRGRALFTLGDEEIEAAAGQIVVAPANVPHKFTNLGPGVLEQIDIHANPTFVTEWLE
ncbi:cupin [Devosia geojensis]|uniref:Cupin n=1 Tax=Devosia geojensis TaxID=443610 RepID=A0A0F5FWF1_9HYPH|nr:cupin domain-containing protein [Devosia geojensis]KKB12905.1 cupin [Devosia geojensis]